MHFSESSLPIPPDDEQKFSYIKRHVWLLNIFALCSFAAVAYSTIRFAELDTWLWPSIALICLTAIGLALSMQADLFSRDFDEQDHRRQVLAWSREAGRYPTVDVFLPICG